MLDESEKKIINCLKSSKNNSKWLTLLQDEATKDFYFMGYGGMGTSIITEIHTKFQNIIEKLIEDNKLIIEDNNYYSIDYNRNFILYKWNK